MKNSKSVQTKSPTATQLPGQTEMEFLRQSPGPSPVTIGVNLTFPWDVWMQLAIIAKSKNITVEECIGNFIESQELCDAWNECRDGAKAA